LRALTAAELAAATALAEQWNLGSSMTRAIAAISKVADA
jgi:hypothetical protein